MDSRVHFRAEQVKNPRSESLGKPKKTMITDTRRTTPRQLKHRQQAESNAVPDWLSGSLPQTPAAGTKAWPLSSSGASVSENGAGSKPSAMASTLFRSASLRLRSTLSRLRRSNSGHADSGKAHSDQLQQRNKTPSSNRRSSDPLKVVPAGDASSRTFEGLTVKAGQTSSSKSSRPTPEVALVASPRKVKQSKLEFDLRGAPTSEAPSPPGCSVWSTRLDAYSPQTPKTPHVTATEDSRLVYHSQGPLLLHPVLPKGITSPLSCEKDKTYYEDWILDPTSSVSLPASDSGALNSVFIDDCMEYGDLGRLNFRTGSFMGRYPVAAARSQRHPRTQHQNAVVRLTNNTTNNNVSSLATDLASPSRGGAGRSLYLSPCIVSSGHVTTRSAPSPSLSSGTSNSGQAPPISSTDSGTAAAGFRTEIKLPMEVQPGVAAASAQLDVSSQKSIISVNGSQSAAAVSELEPVLARLLCDVSSIEEFRSALRPNAAGASGTHDSSPAAAASVDSTSSAAVATDNQQQSEWSSGPLACHVTAQPSRSVFASDSGCGTGCKPISGACGDQLRAFSPSGALPTRLDPLDWRLRRQINDLIQLEFGHPQSFRFSPVRATPPPSSMHTSSSPALKEKSDSLHSEPSVDLEVGQTDNEQARALPTRHRLHPFRWSGSGSQHAGRRQLTRKLAQLNPLVRTRQTDASAGGSSSADRIITILDKPAGARMDRSHLGGSDLLSATTTEVPKVVGVVDGAICPFGGWASDHCVTFWTLSVGQMVALRKLATMQLTPLAEKYCNNRSPFNWRILKYRGTGNQPEGESQNRLEQLENSMSRREPSAEILENSAPLLDSSSPCDTLPEVLPAAFSHLAVSTCPKVIRPGWTLYEGPVFGQPLATWQQRCGYPLPPNIVNMMNHLVEVGSTAHGVFRRPGGKLRVLALRQKLEKHQDWDNFTDWQPYDVADLLKQFFRELPESLLTSKLSTLLVTVFNHVAPSNHLELLRWSMLCLPDENRTVLEKLLYLLHGLLQHVEVTKMSASNLAVCFAPSLFRLGGIHASGGMGNSSGVSSSGSAGGAGGMKVSPRRLRRTTSGPDPKDLADQRTAQMALGLMISNAPNLFQVSIELLRQSHLLPAVPPVDTIDRLAPDGDWSPWLEETCAQLVRDCSCLKTKVWTPVNRETWKVYQTGSAVGDSTEGLEVHYKKHVDMPSDLDTTCPLRTWRCSLAIPEVTASVAMAIFRNQRASWDLDVDESRVLEKLSHSVDLHLLTHTGIFPQPARQLLLLRGTLRSSGSAPDDLGGLALVSQSVAGPSSLDVGHCLGIAYEENLYVRPLADRSGCRVYLLSRVDLRGHGADWYVNHWGHTLVRRLLNFRRACRGEQS